MGTVDVVVLSVGAVLALVGGIWIIAHAFGRGCLMGLACIFVPLVSPIYALFNLRELWKPVVMWAIGLALILVVADDAKRAKEQRDSARPSAAQVSADRNDDQA